MGRTVAPHQRPRRCSALNGAPSARPVIAIVTSVFPPSIGGCEQYHLFTARDLADRARVVVLTSDINLQGFPAPARDDGIEVEYLSSWLLFGEQWMRPRELWRSLRKIRPDFVWLNCPSLGADLGGWYAIITGIPWAATYHSDLSQDGLLRRWFTRIEHILLRRANLVFVTSERYRAKEEARGIAPRRIRAVPTGPYVGGGRRLETSGPGAAEAAGPGPEHRLLFVGGLDRAHAYKRLELLLAAVAEPRDPGAELYLWVVGEGDRRPKMERSAAELGISRRVAFLGRIDDASLIDYYHRAWALVMCPDTDTEGFGTVAIEAATYGCPVVASDVVSAAALLERSGGALVYRADAPGGLARAIGSVWDSALLRNRLASAAIQAAADLTWDRLLPQITGPVYQEIPYRPPPTPEFPT